MSPRTPAAGAIALACAVLAGLGGLALPAPPVPVNWPPPIDLNLADAGTLDLLPGVGPKAAERIVQDRAAHGRFHSPAHVRRVPGLTRRVVDRVTRMTVVP